MPEEKKKRSPLGNIRRVQTKSGVRFYARRRYTNAAGEEDEKFKSCRSMDEAKANLANFDVEIREELAGAKRKDPEKHSLLELLDYYETEHVKEAVFVGDEQISGYRQRLGTIKTYLKLYKEFFGNVPDVTKITHEDCRRYMEHVATTPFGKPGKMKLPKRSTINRKLSYLRHAFNIGKDLGWLEKNPFNSGAKKNKPLINSKAEEPRERILEYDEEERLLAACHEPDSYEYERRGKIVKVPKARNLRTHLRLIVIYAIESGMRKKEMFTTTRRQINFDKMIIELNARQTKALKRRFIPISDRLKEELDKLFSTKIFGPDDLIFGGLKNCARSFRTACKRAGIEDLTFHDLRHTAVTWMDEAGVSQPVRKNIVGHVDDRTHQRYNNPSADVLDSTRVKMNEFREKLEERRRKEREAA